MTTDYLLEREVEQVLALLTETNRLVVRTILHTGLRISDVLALRSDQLAPHFWVTEAKTGKRKQVGLPESLLRDLRGQAGEYYVFEHRKDPKKHRTRQTIWWDVKRAAKAMRMPQNVAPHSFRKVYAVELLERYGDLERVKRALNHRSDVVTMIYAMADKRLQAKGKRRRNGKGKKA